ncbi:phycobilisome linker polypeptide [Leptothoe sp. PORK10 BA2]|jgi:phycoerythrin-associated linker protein|uniref:phycobilisome linker polypeptide n=1 Tax=Leptothoe sp. PORK10 BA2 TaxID=3110254 RepID=UPI002B1F53E4|nr:phycobilisome linker polypeptide [Leptothoe sp. PORK10 BA2]MEA5465415.1 phycobilisome linker polypeptide [Leptothoe sp. PORK10 BA2]
MAFGPASRLGVSLFDETPPVEWVPGLDSEGLESIIKAVYRQVLGNAYVMESERLAVPESQFKRGELTVRDFVRAVAKSDMYRARFFESCPRYRNIELNFRHLLGRAPNSFAEMKAHSAVLDAGGFEAEIDSYIDSDEYQNVFGQDFVPYIRGYKTEASNMVGFTHTFELVRGASSSSLKGSINGKKPRLNALVINAKATPVLSPLSAGGTFQNPPDSSRTRHGVGASANGKIYRVEVTSYRSNAFNRVSKFRRSNKVYMVPFDKLSDEYKRIHKEGGVIASITPVA